MGVSNDVLAERPGAVILAGVDWVRLGLAVLTLDRMNIHSPQDDPQVVPLVDTTTVLL